MEIGIWTAILTAIVAAFAGLGATGYIIWDIKRFQGQMNADFRLYKEGIAKELTNRKDEINKELTQFKMRLDAQAKIHTDSLHRQNGALIYVTKEDCDRNMAACPVARSVVAFNDLEKKLTEMGEKLAQTRECFIEAMTAIKTTMEQLMKERNP
jgi:hypothetical protein